MSQNPPEKVILNRDQETLLLSLAVKTGVLSDEMVKEADDPPALAGGIDVIKMIQPAEWRA